MDKDEIKNATRDYWEFSQNNDPDFSLSRYICEREKGLDGKSLLEAELECARKEKRIMANHCETLVLLVGLSLEPLLQSVCVHDPKRIVLLLNEEGYLQEEWQDFARHMTAAIELLKEKGLIKNCPQFLGDDASNKPGYSTEGKPSAVFKTLVENLHNECDVVIDVTGGKKSMVTGAFLYAAYTGARISYVDFEEYDNKERRPYGFGCKIGELSNPYEEFALREWERVRTFYERYQFRDAKLLLVGENGKGKFGTIYAAMEEYLPDSQTPIGLLVRILCCYEDWDAGLYNEAAEKARDIGIDIDFSPPTAVTCLEGKWVVTKQDCFEKVPFNFYEDIPEFKAYVYDELARICRLIEYNCDYRSAFLRASSLNEALMLARLIKMIEDESKRKDIVKILQSDTPTAKSVFHNLARPEGGSFQIASNGGNNRIRIRGAPKVTITIKKQTEWWTNLSLFDGCGNWEQFFHLRNDLAHKYYSPPLTWAEDAKNFVAANVEDFWDKSMSSKDLQTSALPWSKLVRLCGIDRYLPPNLR